MQSDSVQWRTGPPIAERGGLYQRRIELTKAARGHATHIDDIVLNVTKFRSQILCSLHGVMGRSACTIEVLRLSV